MSRRAFSLMEVVVFGVIGLAIIGGVLSAFSSSRKEMARTQLHLRGLSAASALLERLALDLRGGVHFENPYVSTPFQLKVTEQGQVLELYRYSSDPKKIPASPIDGLSVTPTAVEQVRYAFDPKTGRVTRKRAGEKAEVILAARYRSVKFERIAHTPTAGQPALLANDNLLRVEVKWLPEEIMDTPAAERSDTLALVVSFGLDGEALLKAHPWRNLNPTSKFVVEELGREAQK